MNSNRVIALVVATLVSTASFAGAQVTTGRADRTQAKVGAQRGLLKGVKLSAAEKGKLKEIRAKYQTDAKPLHESMKPAMAEARAARQKGDTAAVRAVLERTKGDREKARALRERQMTEVRSALSADNQKLFDANLKQVKAQAAKRVKEGRGARAKQGRQAGKALGRTRPNA